MKQPWIGLALLLVAAAIIVARGIIKKHRHGVSYQDLFKESIPGPLLIISAIIISAIIVAVILRKST